MTDSNILQISSDSNMIDAMFAQPEIFDMYLKSHQYTTINIYGGLDIFYRDDIVFPNCDITIENGHIKLVKCSICQFPKSLILETGDLAFEGVNFNNLELPIIKCCDLKFERSIGVTQINQYVIVRELLSLYMCDDLEFVNFEKVKATNIEIIGCELLTGPIYEEFRQYERYDDD